jgi:hypothetical protein
LDLLISYKAWSGRRNIRRVWWKKKKKKKKKKT